MTVHKLTRLNLWFVSALGIYGFVTDEPYWRNVGHSPWMYDFLFWFGLFLNGPSGLAADYVSWSVSPNAELQFVVQYILWFSFLMIQWRSYHAAAAWSLGNIRRTTMLYTASLFLMIAAGYGSYEAWMYVPRLTESVIDRYFWFVRIAGIASAGLVLIAYRIYLGRTARNATLSTERTQYPRGS